ncbi:MAG: hypothetical protein ACSHXI_05860 [Hoeflea sp.]|uniref:hypothetical protein n=1 Tax=Hoeflea sp. TaxID=1940281 RepID=UPI003EF4AF99
MSDTDLEALRVLAMAHGQVLETVLSVVLGQMSVENSRLVKPDLGRNEEKYLSGYSGGLTDAGALQAMAKILQSEIDRILEGAESVERSVRGV